jgi:hypothetical protein
MTLLMVAKFIGGILMGIAGAAYYHKMSEKDRDDK